MEKCGILLFPPIIRRNFNKALNHCSDAIHQSFPSSIPPLKCSIKSEAATSIDAARRDLGLIFDLGKPGSWDCKEVGSPVVKRFISDDEERWYMWYHGSSKEGETSPNSIGLAMSNNGVHWERGNRSVESADDVGLVMQCASDWWAFDTQSIRPSEVVVMSSNKVRTSSCVYWLFYTGYFTEGVTKSLPGLAMGQDGRYWARIEGEHHTGALFDAGSGWDSQRIANPKVVVHEFGDFRMYYDTVEAATGGNCIGLATSRDGMKWVKMGKILGPGKEGCFDEGGVMNCSVRKVRDSYVMAYEGVNREGKRSIGIARSSDGIGNWGKVKEEAVLEPLEGWDNGGVGSPCLMETGDEWRMYYSGAGEDGRSGIGLAVSKDLSCFKRWAGFHL